jgi:hypothetical protein
MWKSKCQTCEWTSGEAYLKSVAQAIGKLHEEDNAGHKVAMKQVSTFDSGVEEKETQDLKGRKPPSPDPG